MADHVAVLRGMLFAAQGNDCWSMEAAALDAAIAALSQPVAEAVAMRIVLPRGSAGAWENYDAQRVIGLTANGWNVQVAYDIASSGLRGTGENT